MKMTAKLFTVLMSALMIFSLTGCVMSVHFYDHGSEYTAGDFETASEITTLDIDWSTGSVNVSYHDKDTVSVTETCNAELTDAQRVHTWLDGKTLHIRFCKSGESFELNNAEKKLEVKLPKTAELENLIYDGSSAGASFEGIYANDFSVDTSSGAVRLSGCSADTFTLDSSSGNICLEQTGESGLIEADSSSGSVSISAETVRELKTDTSSGDVKLTVGSADKVSANASSGTTELRLADMPSEIDMDASSGDIRIYAPKDAGFTADVDTSSGSFDSDIALTKNGDAYVSGSGECRLSIDTSSGDVTIKAAE